MKIETKYDIGQVVWVFLYVSGSSGQIEGRNPAVGEIVNIEISADGCIYNVHHGSGSWHYEESDIYETYEDALKEQKDD